MRDYTGMAYLAALGLVGFIGYTLYRKGQGAVDAAAAVARDVVTGIQNTAKATVDAVNPTKDTNLAYRASSVVTAAVSGDPVATLGTKLAEIFSSDVKAADAAIAKATGTAVPPTPLQSVTDLDPAVSIVFGGGA